MFTGRSNSKVIQFDCIIIGAGIFGLYAASILLRQGKKVAVIDKSQRAFSRASAINQARVHNGYHYPRSYQTARSAAYYYSRFVKDFDFAINSSFKQVYAIAHEGSRTSATGFIQFCRRVGIPLDEVDSSDYFKKDSVDASFITQESSFNFSKIKSSLLDALGESITFFYGTSIGLVGIDDSKYVLSLTNGKTLVTPFVINASYSGINEIIEKFDQIFFDIKYEICEIAFCKVSKVFRDVGITVMDGDYFSIMPFGDKRLHTLTSVGHTPHLVSYKTFPEFSNEIKKPVCKMHKVRGCLICSQNLPSAWRHMYDLSRQFLKSDFNVKYEYSQFEIKPILTSSEDDDSRPTIIRKHTSKPTFVSVLPGKISTIYDLARVCEEEDNFGREKAIHGYNSCNVEKAEIYNRG